MKQYHALIRKDLTIHKERSGTFLCGGWNLSPGWDHLVDRHQQECRPEFQFRCPSCGVYRNSFLQGAIAFGTQLSALYFHRHNLRFALQAITRVSQPRYQIQMRAFHRSQR